MLTSHLTRWVAAGLLAACGLLSVLSAAEPAQARPSTDLPLLEIGPTVLPGTAPGEAPRSPSLRVAQSTEAAQLTLRIQQLEEQVRSLTGQVEGLQFQLTQMQTLVERMNDDFDFRFKQLEGGGAATPSNATAPGNSRPSGSAAPSGGTSAPANTTAPGGSNTPAGKAAPTGTRAPTNTSGQTQVERPTQSTADISSSTERLPAGEPVVAPVLNDQPMDDIGPSADPLIGRPGAGASAALGNVPEADVAAVAKAPLDLSLPTGKRTGADADAQYAAGYEAAVRGDYDFARQQFSQFVQLYPDDPRLPDATNWLGESLIQLGSYDDAAQVLFEGFQKFEHSDRAPDLLLRLGIALAGADEADTACRTFAEVKKRYPNEPAAFENRLTAEARRARCQG